MEIRVDGVNGAFETVVKMFHTGEDAQGWDVPLVRKSSRNGDVIAVDEPVTVTYNKPTQRVLFNVARDPNPFLHLYEALWMLAGRNDVVPLAYYAKQMQEFSDDGKTLNGAYGYRWRKAAEGYAGQMRGETVDQLDLIVAHLKANPNSRRAVLQMWNVEDDLLKIGHEATNESNKEYRTYSVPSKDVCCNLSVMFKLRGVSCIKVDYPPCPHKEDCTGDRTFLDITVTNRSNDAIWGMLGTNVVTFSILQEYMAARLGVEVGRYHQFTNDLHVYEWNWKPTEWLKQYDDLDAGYPHPWERYPSSVPLVKDAAAFEQELPKLVESFATPDGMPTADNYSEPFLQTVTKPMLMAFRYHKLKAPQMAWSWIDNVKADDWRIAATNWLGKRLK